MEIELYSKIQDPVKAITQIGEFFAKSTMFGCERIEQGQVLAMECLATGKPPSVIARTYHIMDGKLSKKALAALAEFRGMGGKHKWVKDGTDGKEAVLELTMDGNTITSRFTIDDAKRLGVAFKSAKGNDTNWTKSPANMLRARCISNGVAMLAPEIFAGDVEDEDMSERPTPEPLLKPQQPAVTASAPAQPASAPQPEKKPENVIDVPAEVVKSAEAADEPAKKYTEADIAISPETQQLTVNSLAALESVITEKNLPKAILWLKNKGWITEGMATLSEERAKRIMRKPEQFLGEVLK